MEQQIGFLRKRNKDAFDINLDFFIAWNWKRTQKREGVE